MKRHQALLLGGTLLLLCVSAASPALAQGTPQKKSMEELEEIVGPIALYPDSLLAYVLQSASAPDELQKASDYLQKSGGQAKLDDPEAKALSEAIQALLPFPDVIANLVDYPDWTGELADAMALQESDVIDAIQAFRRKANEAGNLESNDQVKVVVEQDPATKVEVIQIQPASPEVIYVPT